MSPTTSAPDIVRRVPTDEELDAIPPEMQRVFLVEAAEDLKQLRLAALALEEQPDEVEPLLAMSRVAHKIRGTASTLNFDALAELALIFEDHLAAIHSRQATLDAGGVSTLVRYIMLVQEALAAAQEGRPQDPSWILQARSWRQRQRIGSASALDEHASAAPEVMPLVTRPLPAVAAPKPDLPPRPAPSPEADSSVRVDVRRLDHLMNHVSDLALNRASLAQIRSDGLRLQEEMERALARLTELSTDIIESYPALARRATPGAASARLASIGDAWDSLEGVRQDELDHALRVLAEVVSDLTTTSRTLRSTLTRLSSISDDQAHIAAEIQRDVTQIRLVPLGDIVPRLQLEVRGLASQLSKHIGLTVQGEMTQIDRNVSEALSEPLLQLVRNAAMHGIEPLDERRALSKPETGSIWLHAYHVGGEVIIEVGDDGRGINPHVLAASAVALGVLDADAARMLSIPEALDLMFWPGVTGKPGADVLGGRGIGLVDVRKEVEALKGSIHVHNSAGQSTVFRIRVPMSLSIVRALLVRSGEFRYAIPFASVLRTVTLADGDIVFAASDTMDVPNGSAATRHIVRLAREHTGTQNELLSGAHTEVPVVALLDLLGLDYAGRDAQTALIVQVRRGQVALLVDEIYGDQEVVVRALPAHLRRKSVRGTTVTPSGEVLLLLDVSELAAHVLEGGPLPMPHAPRPLPQPAQSLAPRVLVVDDSISIRRSLEQALDHAGFEVQLARDGIEALEMMLASLPHVVVLDIEMPRLDGFELLSILHGSSQFEGVRVAILTSRATDKHRERAASLGASAYLVKPCPAETLIETVRTLIGEPARIS
jgi:chemosensory pili system protein ChpA (sensor histidine kinase/response regulator)